MEISKLKEEYAYWKTTVANMEKESSRLQSKEDLEHFHFARGFVAAVDKSGVLSDRHRVGEEVEGV